jgi:hypothetical protein
MSPARRAAALALAVSLPLVAAVELVASFVVPAPPVEAYEPLEDAVERVYQPGDLVVMSPRWAEPNARAVLGDTFMRLPDVARSDVSRYRRALEISLGGARSDELASFRETGSGRVGPFELRELENPAPEPVVYDFLDHLDPDDASVSGTEPVETCAWTPRARVLTGGLSGHPTFPRKRFQCGGGPFFGVGVTVIADERFLPRRCIFAHPTEHGERVLRFERVPLGERVVGHAGMYWMIERTLAGAPIDLAVRVDGDEIGSVRHVDGDGWKRFELPLGSHAGAASATVEIAISSPAYVDRHFCFEATVR